MSTTPSSFTPSSNDVVTAFDSARRTWVTTGAGPQHAKLPALEGSVLVAAQALQEAAEDFGHVVQRKPSAVFQPRSVEDIVQMVRFARQHRLKLNPRGQSHTMYGHAQTEGGIILDMRQLATIHSIGEDRATVDAGVRWSELVARAAAVGKTPPVLTDFLELTVGGTLSVGGVSGTSFRYGVQVDNVLELQVVTGEGQKVTCSATENKALFEAALAGLGQCAIIVQATVRLVPAPAMVRFYDLGYTDGGTQARDVLRANASGLFDYVLGMVVPAPGGGWVHRMHALGYHKAGGPPEDAKLLEGLSFQKGSEQIMDMPYMMWVNRLVPQVTELANLGQLNRPHPWCDLLVPASKIETLLNEILKEVPPAEISPQFPVLMYGFKREKLAQPLFRTPDEDTFFLLDVLRTASPETQPATQMVAHNRKLYERNRQWGGTFYTISAIAMSPEDWKQHYGPAYEGLVAAKRRYDPDNVLTPGPGIFA